jgi:ADP-ribose diphosphatase
VPLLDKVVFRQVRTEPHGVPAPDEGDDGMRTTVRAVTVVHRELRHSSHGNELRWALCDERAEQVGTGRVLHRGVLRHAGICVIVPYLTPDTILLVRQYRYAVDAELWELPAGTLPGREEDGRVLATEPVEACAARELSEETGYVAGGLRKIGECYAMPGMSDELMHIFVARDLTRGTAAPDPGEEINEVRAFAWAELRLMAGRGDIRDGKTLAGLFQASLSPGAAR